MTHHGDEIVIIGFSCRLPLANTIHEYWSNLLAGNVGTYQHRQWSDGSEAKGGFLEHFDCFDSTFFNISPQEAICMDPQLRQMLEVSYECVATSGASIELLQQLNTGVFTTSLPGDYKKHLSLEQNASHGMYQFLGNAPSALSGRLSYFYNFHGPSVYLDTACSSGLSILHSARMAMIDGECEAALVGSASIFSTNELHELARQGHMLSSSSQCKAFDQSADGFVPSEGVVALMLMNKAKAEQFQLPIYATLEALSLNHDGLSNGLMAPNTQQQARLLQHCYAKANLTLNDVALIESHGTGTVLGDSIELRALQQAFHGSMPKKPCYLGASKAVIGHTLVSSSLASIIKVLLAYQYQQIPSHPLFENPNAYAAIPPGFEINKQTVTWPQDKLYAGISAFGFTGSNGHLILKLPEQQKYAHTFATKTQPLMPLPQPSYPFKKQRFWAESNKPVQKLPNSQAEQDTFKQSDWLPEAFNTTDVLSILKQTLKVLLNYSESNLDPNKSLIELGLDSLSGAQLIKALEKHHISLNMEQLWGSSSLLELAYQLEPDQDYFVAADPYMEQLRLTLGQFNTNDEALYWRRSQQSQGPHLILLPPLNCHYLAWLRQIPFLHQKGYQLHIPHYPGHAPDASCGLTECSLSTVVDELVAYIDKLDSKPHLVGWSLGSVLSLLVALKKQESIQCMTLTACASYFGDDLFEKTLEIQNELFNWKDALAIVYQTNKPITEVISAQAPMTVLKDYYEALTALELSREQLNSIDIPTQIIYGHQDPVVYPEQTHFLMNMNNVSRLDYPRGGHFIPMTWAHDFNQALLQFERTFKQEDDQ